MTTPQDINAALDEMIDGRAGVGDWFLKHKETLLHVLQSHAPEASTVDVEALKNIKHDENHYKNLHPNCNPSHYSGWMHGWNDCIDELLRRGFMQGGGS